MNRLLAVAAIGEAATGFALLLGPSRVVWLLFGAEIVGAGIVMSRVAGIGLIALGLACLPGTAARALSGMLAYSVLSTLYLASVGLGGKWSGPLLWPAIATHAVLTLLLGRAWLQARAGVIRKPLHSRQTEK